MKPFVLFLLAIFSNHLIEAQTIDVNAFHTSRSGLNNAFQVFETTHNGRVAFMGGSITEGHGWRDSICQFLQQQFPQTNFEFINAGISSTGSTPGAFRFSKDVLSHGKIDLFFEEAAVNDPTNGFFGKYALRGMEGIIQQALASNPKMNIVIMHCADPDKIQSYKNGVEPDVITQHEKVAQHYNVNTVNWAKEVAARIQANEFSWEKDFKDLHPSPFGHGIYAHSLISFLKNEWNAMHDSKKAKLPALLDPYSYINGRYVSIDQATSLQGFSIVDKWMPNDGAGTRKQYVQVPALIATEPGSRFSFRFKGKAVGFCITAGPDAGIIHYTIDGKIKGTKDLFTQWSSGLHLPWYILLNDELPDTEHTLDITISTDQHPKSNGHAVRIQQFLVN